MIHDPSGGLWPSRLPAGGVCRIEPLVKTRSLVLLFAEMVEEAPGR